MVTLYHEFYYDPSVEVGITIRRLETKQFWSGSAWVDAEPRPTPMVREAGQPAGLRNLDVPAPPETWPPGDYSVRVWKLAEDGSAAELIDLMLQTIPAQPEPLELRYALGLASFVRR